MTSKSNFRWGILAPGRIAHKFAEALEVVGDAQLYAVASRDPSRGEQFARRYQGSDVPVKVYREYADLIRDPAVDAIYIANPHRFHADCVRQCLEAGKPVLCEKPLTVNAAQAEALFQLAEERNVFLMEALWTRFLPAWQQVRRWIDEGAIGQVHSVNANFCFKIPFQADDRLWDIEQAGGVLLDMGVYPLNLSNFVFGRGPDRIQSSVLKGETGVDVRTAALLDYGDGVSTFTCSFLARRDNGFQIEGSRGVIQMESNFWSATRATLKPFDGESQLFEQPHRANGFEYQIEAAMADIRAGRLENAVIPWADTLATLRVIDQVLATGGVVYPFL
ncbi:Gfo/Idh/MocA family protein [Marinobacter fonticola]|uniref:Gfo/Idh/MocA family protein n=1 Tax=Marinobacter fonticola TaxID=2603215 RepID=UPI0011E7A6C1|nr:Gfo/Idh/MocA family oxidoreductase [Marinobacter fonticola]